MICLVFYLSNHDYVGCGKEIEGKDKSDATGKRWEIRGDNRKINIIAQIFLGSFITR
jgi:hypothetical protein